MVNDDLVVRIGGEGGDGIISMGEILSRAVVRGGLNIHAYRTFPAEIRGGLAMFQLRAGSGSTLSLKQQVDVLLAFNQDAYNTYVMNVKAGGSCCSIPNCASRMTVWAGASAPNCRWRISPARAPATRAARTWSRSGL